MWKWLKQLDLVPTDGQRLRSVGRIILLAGLVGVVAGLGALAFHLLCHVVVHVALEGAAGYDASGPAGEKALFEASERTLWPWMLLIVPTVGGLISGLLVYRFAPEAEGHGTDAAIEAYHHKRGLIRGRVPIVKMLASAITLGTGGSGGREGPIAQIGAGFGSFLATRLKLSDSERRTLMAAGLGAGIGAIFHAPLAGAIFAIEVLYRDPDFEAEALIPAFISTTIAYSVFGVLATVAFDFNAFVPLFSGAASVPFSDPMLLLPLAGLAAAMAVASLVYVRSFYGIHEMFRRLRAPRWIRPAIGALATGALAVGLYYTVWATGRGEPTDVLAVLAFGYGFLQKVLDPGQFGMPVISVLLVVGLGKILTTSLTIGSGGSGGVFGPSMVIGGSLGAVVGLGFHHWTPNLVTESDVPVFAILGMASFFAAAANTPVSTLIMVSEMTASYALLLPSMWVCALAYLLSRGWSIYTQQVASRIDSPAHRGDFIVDILEGLTVRDALTQTGRKFITIPVETTLAEAVRLLTGTTQSCFPVTDAEGKYAGLFSFNDIRQYLYDANVGAVAVAHDLANPNVPPLTLTTNLSGAMNQFVEAGYGELPVVDEARPHEVIGMLRRQDIIAAHSKRLLELRPGSEQ